ncbi:acyltransferase family protein [Nonomuraea muscovyensis]|uniref:Peptidoglycan/LPS O-acetylase OafA/YrhL n=1 Tax=Nonomuraea muscovyensis TaxID=1124761 RepID=A0A7X0C029_9ACTN|nr:acyltransferase [Nonomuraea muscovyensis]MBB6345743.1 peptidoglycan/LPS O-acetylase OafA/YrhL [Nonomuraea muscovyensis]
MTTREEPSAPAVVPRDRYVDWLRALSLIVVVVWHWAFTILEWGPTGPEPTSPLGFTSGLWILTWLLQVLPLFFYVGGHVHLLSWRRAGASGVGIGAFVWRRIRALAVPALVLSGAWVAVGAVVTRAFEVEWMWRVVLLVLSPLWFLGVYIVLVALLPVALWLHRRYDVLALVWLGGAALVVDVVRFRYGVGWVGWLNMVVVWGLAHQAGFFYERIVALPRRYDFGVLWTGLFALFGLVYSGIYPGSMVGVPGDKWSNMAPPTFVIVALLIFQIGIVEVLRPAMERLLDKPGWRRVNETINRFALPLYLFHTTGMAIALGISWWLFGSLGQKVPPDLWWWLERPIAVLGPLICTLPVIYLFGHRRRRAEQLPDKR